METKQQAKECRECGAVDGLELEDDREPQTWICHRCAARKDIEQMEDNE